MPQCRCILVLRLPWILYTLRIQTKEFPDADKHYREQGAKMTAQGCRKIRVIDSHTGGEPTRLVVSGGPDLGRGSLADRLERFRSEQDDFRSAVVNDPFDSASAAGVIFFNNVGYLGMCGHGTIGLVATLAYMKCISPGEHKIETPVGTVSAILHESGEVTVNNVASYRSATDVAIEVPGYGKVRGDVAWGGNWFFLVRQHAMELTLRNIDALTNFTWAIRQALRDDGIAGADGKEIDHIELYGPSQIAGVNSRNFVLCPGKAYDRSPCGTGTSAKLACLYADGKIREGQTWKQESIVGSVFEGTVALEDGKGEMTNYRVKDQTYIVDRLFDRANLVLGTGKKVQKVEIGRGHKQ